MTVRVALYARYSSERQSEASIDDQLRVCRSHAKRQGWVETHAFFDAAISGTTVLRPGYQALLAALRQGGIDIVLAESLDRFSRDPEHGSALYKQVIFAGARMVTIAEGDIGPLQLGMKGTMGALYLQDLAQKTHRGIEGRIRQGRAIGHVPYGYDLVRMLAANGEPDRGLRGINPSEADVVRRIFREYAAGVSPRAIAQTLNAEGIPGPSGGIWYDASIRGRPRRGDGLLRNAIYVGKMVWNRGYIIRDPVTATLHRRKKDPGGIVSVDTPELRIIDQQLWDQVQARLTAMTAARLEITSSSHESGPGGYRFWEQRRPKYLLTGKVVCGVCGATFASLGKDYLGCRQAKQGACRNTPWIRRSHLQAHVLDVLGRQLMAPDLVAEFVTAFSAEWNRLIVKHAADDNAQRRELQLVDRKIANLIDALSEGIRSSDLQARLAGLESRRATLRAELTHPAAPLPAMHPNLAAVYRDKVARLRDALVGPDGAEALEAARELIDQIVITPPEDDGGSPGIEVVGEFMAILKAAGLGDPTGKNNAQNTNVLCAFASSVKVGSGGKAPLAVTPSATGSRGPGGRTRPGLG